MQRDSTVVREDTKLLRQARTVFGDIVNKAWITAYHYDHMAKTDSESMLEDASKRLAQVGKKNEIDLDGQTIMLQFQNGRVVMFTSSEWGTMTSVDISTYRVM